MEKIDIIKIAVLVVILLIVTFIINKAINKFVKKSKYIDKTLLSFLSPLIKLLVYFFDIVIICDYLGINTTSLVAFASVLSAAVALSAQTIIGNFFGGVTILITKPFKIDDYIKIDSMEGSVVQMNMFHTKLKTADGKTITIPNGSVSNSSVINYTVSGKRRIDLSIGLAYETDLNKAKESLKRAVDKTEGIFKDNQLIRLLSFEDSSIVYAVKVWVNQKDYWEIYFNLMENIKICLDEDKIEIPFPQVVVSKKIENYE